MVQIGENRNIWRKAFPTATLSTTNPTHTGTEKPAINRLGHDTAQLSNEK